MAEFSELPELDTQPTMSLNPQLYLAPLVVVLPTSENTSSEVKNSVWKPTMVWTYTLNEKKINTIHIA